MMTLVDWVCGTVNKTALCTSLDSRLLDFPNHGVLKFGLLQLRWNQTMLCFAWVSVQTNVQM